MIYLLLLLSLSAGYAEGAGGQANERGCFVWESQKSIAGSSATFHLDPYPWKVIINGDANVTIENSEKKSLCKTTLDSVVSVFLGSDHFIYFRRSKMAGAEGNLVALEGFTCHRAYKMERILGKLKDGGECAEPALAAKGMAY